MVFGLTGGVASGKSLVSSVFKNLGAHIIDADLVSREITEPGKPAYNEIVKEFGEAILSPDGSIDRKALGSIVFSDREKLMKLNSITHPRIIEEIDSKVAEIEKSRKDPVIIVDAALLIEVGLEKRMSKVVVVYADEDRQIERLMKRDNLSLPEAKKRLSAQMPLKEKTKYADYVIDNNGDMETARMLAAEVYGKLKAAGK